VLPDDEMRCAIETCRSSESVRVCNFRLIYDTISAFVGVQYSVNFQNARCNNKDECYGVSSRTIYLTNVQYVVRCRYDLRVLFGSCIDIISFSGWRVLVGYYLGFERADCFHLQGKVKPTMKGEAAGFSRPVTLLGIPVSIFDVVRISNIAF
jgi:hypothetical protein